jgi:hypothetical protein
MHEMKRDSVFLQLLVKGTMLLYYLKDGDDQNHFFIQKEGEEMEELINYRYLLKKKEGAKTHDDIMEPKYYLDQLARIMSDCELINKDFESGKHKRLPWKREDMQDLVYRYNGLTGGSNEYRSLEVLNERKSRFRWGSSEVPW